MLSHPFIHDAAKCSNLWANVHTVTRIEGPSCAHQWLAERCGGCWVAAKWWFHLVCCMQVISFMNQFKHCWVFEILNHWDFFSTYLCIFFFSEIVYNLQECQYNSCYVKMFFCTFFLGCFSYLFHLVLSRRLEEAYIVPWIVLGQNM